MYRTYGFRPFLVVLLGLSAITVVAPHDTVAAPQFQAAFYRYPGSDVHSVKTDLNADGKLDVIAGAGATFNVYLNNGDGTFLDPQPISLPADATGLGMAIADFNGDGHPDLVVTCSAATGGFYFVRGAGGSSFLPAVRYSVAASYPVVAAAGDVNGDGKADVVVADSGVLTVRFGNGDGTFGAESAASTLTNVTALALADLNGDGKMDIVVTGDEGVRVIFDYAYPVNTTLNLSAPSKPIDLRVADIDEDGHLDIATSDDIDVRFYKGHGTSVFDPWVTIPAGPKPEHLDVADFDGDGHLDIVASQQTAGSLSTVRGHGNGTFDAPVLYGTVQVPAGVMAGDFNQDGHQDFIAISFAAGLEMHFGNGNGTFGAWASYLAGTQPTSVVLGDVNRDGRRDMFTVGHGDNSLSVFVGNGNGSFQPRVIRATDTGPKTVAVADLDEDGFTDVLVSNANSISRWPGGAGGALGTRVDIPLAGTRTLAVGDFNGDSHRDVVVGRGGASNFVTVLLGDGHGGLTAAGDYPTTVVTSIAIGDLNGDGHPDLATCSGDPSGEHSQYVVSILLGNGDGSFKPHVDYPCGTDPMAVAIGDLDGDSHADVVTANYHSGSLGLLYGNGNGTLQSVVSLNADNVQGVAIADLDGDGKPELIGSQTVLYSVAVFKNLGGRAFEPLRGFAAGAYPSAIAVGDVSGDGRPDLVVTGEESNTLFVLRNLGAWTVTGVGPQAPVSALRLSIAPNPASRFAEFAFDVRTPARARLEIFDAAGRRVARVFDAASSGTGMVRWNGRTAAGQPLRSGMYLARLAVGSETIVRPFVWLGR